MRNHCCLRSGRRTLTGGVRMQRQGLNPHACDQSVACFVGSPVSKQLTKTCLGLSGQCVCIDAILVRLCFLVGSALSSAISRTATCCRAVMAEPGCPSCCCGAVILNDDACWLSKSVHACVVSRGWFNRYDVPVTVHQCGNLLRMSDMPSAATDSVCNYSACLLLGLFDMLNTHSPHVMQPHQL